MAYADGCGYFTYGAGRPGQFAGGVEGYYIVRDGYWCGVDDAINYISGRRVAGVGPNSPAYMDIIIPG